MSVDKATIVLSRKAFSACLSSAANIEFHGPKILQ